MRVCVVDHAAVAVSLVVFPIPFVFVAVFEGINSTSVPNHFRGKDDLQYLSVRFVGVRERKMKKIIFPFFAHQFTLIRFFPVLDEFAIRYVPLFED